MYVFTFDDYKNGGQITMGVEPNGINKSSKKHWKTDVEQNNNNGHWLIQFKSIFFDDDTLIPIDTSISIGIGGCIFSVKKELFEIIISKYMQSYIDNKQC